MKYVFIENHQAEFSIKAICRVLRIARSGWYAWRLRHHQQSPRQQFRLICNAAVRKAFTEAKQRYGAPRLADETAGVQHQKHCCQSASSGAQGKSRTKVQPGQLPWALFARVRKSVETRLQGWRPEPEVGG